MNKQRGMALLMVLMIITTLTLLAASATEYWRQQFVQTLGVQTEQQQKWALTGAESLFLRRMNATEVRGGQSGSVTLQDINIQWRLRDVQACFNLNSLLTKGRSMENGAYYVPVARRIFLNLLGQLGMEEDAAHALLNNLLRQVKAHPDDITGTGFVDASQINSIENVDRTLLHRLAPLLCALPETRLQVSLNGLEPAQAILLSALFMGTLTEARAKELLENRPIQGWPTADNFAAALSVGEERKAFSQVIPLSTVKSQHYQLRQWVTGAPHYRLNSRIYRPAEHFYVSARFRE